MPLMKMSVPLALLSTLVPSPAWAGIIGMLWSHAGSNVAIEAGNEAGRPQAVIRAANDIPCAVRLYRRSPADLDEAPAAPEPDEDGVPTIAFGLWFDRDCYFKHYDTPQKQREPKGPRTYVIDLDKEVLGRPFFAKFRDPFLKGELRIALCLQQSAPGDGEQGLTCPSMSYQDTQAGKVVYQSRFSIPPPVDLGLTGPRPVREDLSIAAAYFGPGLRGGQAVVKPPELTAKLEGFRLELKDAYNLGDVLQGRDDYHRFYFYNGMLLDEGSIRQVARRGETFCELTLHQPKSLRATESVAAIPPQEILVYAGGGGCKFCLGKTDPELETRRYWTTYIDVNRSYLPKPADRTVISHFSCAKPHGNRTGAADGAAVRDAYQHLRLQGRQLLTFYSNFPGYQAPQSP